MNLHPLLFTASIACTGCAAIPSAGMQHYKVHLDVYVRDQEAACNRAWDLAVADHGPMLAEIITMPHGEFDVAMCIATIYQKTAGDVVESRGIEVSRK